MKVKIVIRFIGDIHGDYEWYNAMINDCPHPSVQVGDFGMGFPIQRESPNWNHMLDGGHKFIRGNHDDPALCRVNACWIPDGTIENGVAFIGGASSIDRQWRTAGLNLWPDEEISLFHHGSIRENIMHKKPHTIVSHDCPLKIIPKLFPNALPFASQTQLALQEILESCPSIKTWIFGHWHENVDKEINGVRFICLGINQYKDLEI